MSSENESLSSVADKWTKYEETRRASLLEKHPEEDRDSLKGLPLESLEYVTNKIVSSKSNAPEIVGKSRQNEKPIENVWELDSKDRKANWSQILKQYSQKKN